MVRQRASLAFKIGESHALDVAAARRAQQESAAATASAAAPAAAAAAASVAAATPAVPTNVVVATSPSQPSTSAFAQMLANRAEVKHLSDIYNVAILFSCRKSLFMTRYFTQMIAGRFYCSEFTS